MEDGKSTVHSLVLTLEAGVIDLSLARETNRAPLQYLHCASVCGQSDTMMIWKWGRSSCSFYSVTQKQTLLKAMDMGKQK